MATWLLITITVVTVAVAMLGIGNFPYVNWFFGLYDSRRYSLRGRLLSIMIWLYVPMVVVCLYIAWTGDRRFSYFPLVYLVITWSLRLNKPGFGGPKQQYTSSQENSKHHLSLLEKEWPQWESDIKSNGQMQFEFFSSDEMKAKALGQKLQKWNAEQNGIDIVPNDNGTYFVKFSTRVNQIDKSTIIDLINKLVNAAWEHQSELWFIYH